MSKDITLNRTNQNREHSSQTYLRSMEVVEFYEAEEIGNGLYKGKILNRDFDGIWRQNIYSFESRFGSEKVLACVAILNHNKMECKIIFGYHPDNETGIKVSEYAKSIKFKVRLL